MVMEHLGRSYAVSYNPRRASLIFRVWRWTLRKQLLWDLVHETDPARGFRVELSGTATNCVDWIEVRDVAAR